MSLDIGDAVRRGFNRTVARNGLFLVAITYVLNLVNGLFGPPPRMYPEMVPAEPTSLITVPFVIDSLLSLVFTVGGIFVAIAAFRVFTGEETETLPEEVFTRNAFSAFVNVFIGGIIFAVAVTIGFVLLIIPGLFLLVSLIFWPLLVAVEDENFIDAFTKSWQLTSGHRLSIFGLGVVVVAIGLLASLVATIPSILLGPLAVFIASLVAAFVAIFGDAVLASAYNQLLREEAKAAAEAVEAREESAGTDTAGESTDTDSTDESA